MATMTAPEYVTKGEVNLRINAFDEKLKHERERNDTRLDSLEDLIDTKIDKLQILMEKNLAKYEAVASGMRAEISDIRGDVKALSAELKATQNKIGWYISLMGIGVTVILGILQMIAK